MDRRRSPQGQPPLVSSPVSTQEWKKEPQEGYGDGSDDWQGKTVPAEHLYAVGRTPDPHSNLLRELQQMNGGGYGQLKSLTGRRFFLEFGNLVDQQHHHPNPSGKHLALGVVLTFLHVQSDPFAPGSQVEVELPLPFDMYQLLMEWPERTASQQGAERPVSHPLPHSPHDEKDTNADRQQRHDAALWQRMVAIRQVAAEDYLLRAWKRKLCGGWEEEDREAFEGAPTRSPNGGARHPNQTAPRCHQKGRVEVIKLSPHILPRSAAQLVVRLDSTPEAAAAGGSFIRFYARVKLPGHGRRIDSPGIIQILRDEILHSTAELWAELSDPTPSASATETAQQALLDSTVPTHRRPPHNTVVVQRTVARAALRDYLHHIHDQEWLRGQLEAAGLVAFVANGAILPRAAGNSSRPLSPFHPSTSAPSHAFTPTNGSGGAVPFESPPSLARQFTLPCSGRTLTGMGLPRGGLTLIAGGGFHGKSTLLRALELGIYNHTPSDGRAFVVTCPTAVKIRAEDRRAVHGVDIHSFISNLPFQKDTHFFVTSEASGSTSQAANLMEALELGAGALLLDEDTSATNLMYRDALVQALVPSAEEPITSLVDRIPELVKQRGVSVILVVGGSGQYFVHADVVLVLRQYRARDATAEAKAIVAQHHPPPRQERNDAGTGETNSTAAPFGFFNRHVDPAATFSSLVAGNTVEQRRGPPALARGRGYRGGRGGATSHRDPLVQPSTSSASASSYFSEKDGPSISGSPTGGGGRLKMSASSASRIRVGLDEEIDLSLVEQIVEEGQLQAIAQCLAFCHDRGESWVDRVQVPPHQSPAPAHSATTYWDWETEVERAELETHGRTTGYGTPPALLPSPSLRLPLPSTALQCSPWTPPRGGAASPLFPLGAVSHYTRLVFASERALRHAQLELETPSAYIPRGFTSLTRVMEIGAALNRLRSLRTRKVR